MKSPYDIIIKPLVSEKSMKMQEKNNTYVFLVSKDSNKIEVKAAVEKIFPGVKVGAVRTMSRLGKAAKFKFGHGYRPDTKKAIVSLKQGRIDIV